MRSTARARPRVLVVITEMRIGGASLTALEAARALQDEFDFSFVCGRATEPNPVMRAAAAEFPLHEISTLVRPIRPPADARAIRALRSALRLQAPAIVHSHSSKAGVLARLAARRMGIPVIHTIHGWGHSPDDAALRRLVLVAAERVAARWSGALVAVSADVMEEGIALGIGRREQYTVVPGFVDFAPSYADWWSGRQEARDRLELAMDHPVIGWVGRFEPHKDPVVLTDVLARVLALHPRRRAVLVGDGSQRTAVEVRLEAAGVKDRVTLTGSRSDVRTLYAAFDVLLHTSRREGHPRVPQEAIAERVPVVMAATAGTHDILIDPRAGLSVRPGDVDGFAAGLELVLDRSGPRAPLEDEVVVAVAAANGRAVSVPRMRELYESFLVG